MRDTDTALSADTHPQTDLDSAIQRLMEEIASQPDWSILEIFADRQLVRFASGNPLSGVFKQTRVMGDLQDMPFTDETFDLVVAHHATSHLADCFRFVQEGARMLKSGGVLLVEDLSRPDEPRAGAFVDAFERLRDPSHQRTYAGYEWRGMFLDADLTVEHDESSILLPARKLLPWAEASNCPPEIVTRLQIMLAQAPPAVAAWMFPNNPGTPEATFCQHDIIIMGRKKG